MPMPAALKEGLEIPVIASPMFIVSGTNLVIETCKQGIIGTFPALNARPSSQFEEWLDEIETVLATEKAAKFGVNLIVHKSNTRLEADLEIIVRHKVPLIITSVGLRKDVIDAVHSYGGLVFHDVIHMHHARKAIQAGVDGVIIVCNGAGGHAGTINPFTFVSQLRAEYDGAIILAGTLGDGRQVRAAQVLGADFAYMGTRFIATEEAHAPEAYKQMILDSGSLDLVYTDKISGIQANFLKKSLENAGLDWTAGGVAPETDMEHEAKAWKDVWSAGQGIGQIHDVPSVKALADRLKAEYSEAVARPVLD